MEGNKIRFMASEAPAGLSAGDLQGGSHCRLSAEGFRCLGQTLRFSPDRLCCSRLSSSASPRLLLKGVIGVWFSQHLSRCISRLPASFQAIIWSEAKSKRHAPNTQCVQGKYRNGVLSSAPVTAIHGVRVRDGGDGTGRVRHVCLSIRSLSLRVPAPSFGSTLMSLEMKPC